jgi:hypothetical protein
MRRREGRIFGAWWRRVMIPCVMVDVLNHNILRTGYKPAGSWSSTNDKQDPSIAKGRLDTEERKAI